MPAATSAFFTCEPFVISTTGIALLLCTSDAAPGICPTWIQTCLLAWDGAPPSEAEQEAYLEAIRSLVRDAVPVRGVLLYSVARASKQPDAEHVAPLSDAWLRAFATRIEEAGLAVKVTA